MRLRFVIWLMKKTPGLLDWARGFDRPTAAQDFEIAAVGAQLLRRSARAKNAMEQLNQVRGENLDKFTEGLQ